ncbi:hypothetical protein LSH36_316g01038 [Paralvinella palmiformis]|uniref:BTB domain-containing protein n=1 Tax=Paralvinella palmiformis TaxID=53620 RepID=A0AAD9N2Q3_9ANNE|nr:hypothetical protein LSH36_316g01038 [Paralvinella palmiformis]
MDKKERSKSESPRCDRQQKSSSGAVGEDASSSGAESSSTSQDRVVTNVSSGPVAANQPHSAAGDHHIQPQNQGVSNLSSSSACVNANHGSRSHSRNQQRDSRRHRQGPQESKDQEAASDRDGVSTDGEGTAVRPVGAQVGVALGTNSGASLQSASAAVSQPVYYNWQASKANIKERLAFMFNNEIMADVHFLVGKGDSTQHIPAHRFILAVGSAVFDAMFNGGMATTSSEVELPDVEPAAFLALLKFLYIDEVHIGPETVMTTLYTAKKYAVPALEQACVDFLKRNLSSDNAFMLLTQARLFDEPQLAALCLETIDKNTSEALAAEGFADVDLDTLCVVLERDTLGIREYKLFKAACKWAEAECIRQNITSTAESKRRVLGRALQLVRFPLMTVEEFAVHAAQSGILTDREIVQLFLHFTVNPKPYVSFQDTPRCCLTGKEQVVSRFCQIESRWGYSGTSDRIRFMVNRRIFVVGFGLYGSIHGPAEYTVNIQIIHTDSGKVCGQNDPTFQCDGTNSTFRVMFKEPIEIQPNASYTACATLKGPDSYYGTKGLRKVTHESVTSGKVTFQFTYAAGNNNGTSVEDGQIPEIIFYT